MDATPVPTPVAQFAATCGTNACHVLAAMTQRRAAFVLDDGVVYHSYSTYARGLDALWVMYQWPRPAAPPREQRGQTSGGVATTNTQPLLEDVGSCCHARRMRLSVNTRLLLPGSDAGPR